MSDDRKREYEKEADVEAEKTEGELEDETSGAAETDDSPGSKDADRDDSNGFDFDADLGRDRTETDEHTDESPAEPQEGGRKADAPLGSLAASVDERRGRESDRPDDGLFDQESVPEIDADVVWERLDDDEPSELPDEADPDVSVIEKRSYCEQCPFFSEPPDVECNHDGTEILELVDMEHFRVIDCPKVRENKRLERL